MQKSTNLDPLITIPQSRYEDLLEAESWLQALEKAGVDNWDGIDYAHTLWTGEKN